MEQTFYDDPSGKESMKNLKKQLTLDFNQARAARRQKVTLLSSPDLNMLKLASPELEKLIIQQSNGVVTTTPTPTQFIFPKHVTEDQELYAQGFVDALAELHNSDSAQSDEVQSTEGKDEGGNQASSFGAMYAPSGSHDGNLSYLPVHVKEEPQTVPSLCGSPPMSPIDMASQEKIKLERKRQRNRVAASKCRKRKLERIAKLEDKVMLLKGENSELGVVVSKLREQVCYLKEQVMSHVSRGCQMMVTPSNY